MSHSSQKIYFAKTWHKRFFPTENEFTYRTFYSLIPLSERALGALGALGASKEEEQKVIRNQESSFLFAYNKFGIFSYYDKDHGKRDGSSALEWAKGIIKSYDPDLELDKLKISLLTMPRVLGYVFNPVSFWLIQNEESKLIRVICEVNNTFGETHSYYCRPPKSMKYLTKEAWTETEKLFHVSPFLKREGHYKFKFDNQNEKFKVWINYYDKEHKLELSTWLIGNYKKASHLNHLRALITYPLNTVQVIFKIHFQAIKLYFKGVKYIYKPKQIEEKISATKESN